MASNNSNYNKISVKTDSMVELIEQLAKLGVFKEKRKPRAKRSGVPADDVKQPSDMVASTTFPLRVIDETMTQAQIDDAQRANEAAVAALGAEVEQKRLQDVQRQQQQRFDDIVRFGQIMYSDRFRGNPPAGPSYGFKSDKPADTILLGNGEFDVENREFTQTLNEGAPPADRENITNFYAEDQEDEGIPVVPETGGAPLKPVQKIFKEPSKFATPAIKKRAERAKSIGLGPPPQARNTAEEIQNYYIELANTEDFEPDTTITNARGYLKAIERYLDDDGNFLST
jgi:hypothetical protein